MLYEVITVLQLPVCLISQLQPWFCFLYVRKGSSFNEKCQLIEIGDRITSYNVCYTKLLRSWLNPEITNLVPVLKSYWLIIHVAVITASYGFLGIAALLGLLNLILMIFRNPKNIQSISYAIIEIAIVIELAMIIGLVLLTVGAFIGGVWANESWA